jgi:dephospho-CoA kinase
MLILGITGGIATGKSTVTRLLAELGAPTISADALARDLLAPGTETTRQVLRAFPQCADPQDARGLTVDRRALSRVIFADPQARQRLEALTHPPIIAALAAQADHWRAMPSPRAAALEIPLLFEAGLSALVDRVVVVACHEEKQIARLRERAGVDESEARRQIAAQWPLSDKISRADSVITTDDDLAETRQQVQALWEALAHLRP